MRTPARAFPSAASTTRPASVAVGARAIAHGLGGGALGQHHRGAAAVPAVGHERARLARRAVEEEGAVRARLHPARRLRAPLEPHEGARGHGPPIGEGDRPPKDLPERQRHRPGERPGPNRLPLLRGESRRLHADPVPFLGRGPEAERPVGLRHRRLRQAGGGARVLRPTTAARPQRHRRPDDRPSPLVHDPAGESEGLRRPHVARVVPARVEERRQHAGRSGAAGQGEPDRGAGRSGHRDGEGPVRPAHCIGQGLRPVLASRLAPRRSEAVLERQHGHGDAGRRLPVHEHPAADLAGGRRGRERDEDNGGRQEAKGHGGSPGGAKVRRPWDAVEGEKVGHVIPRSSVRVGRRRRSPEHDSQPMSEGDPPVRRRSAVAGLEQVGRRGAADTSVVARQRHGRWSRLWSLRAPTRPPPSG